jgi:Fic family protein
MVIRSLKYGHLALEYPVHHKRKVPFRLLIEPPMDFPARALELGRLDVDLDRFILSGKDFLQIIADAFASNIHKSTQIEGNPLTLEQVRRITLDSFRKGKAKAVDKPTQEIINHLGKWVVPELVRLPWTLETITTTHTLLMKGVIDDEIIGKFRDFQSEIKGDDGVAYFLPAPPQHIKEELQALLDWVNKESLGLFPVIGAAVFFHEFESIHPFADGNGRTGRTLFHSYLQNQGFPNAALCKVEAELLKDPALYYELLAWTDKTGKYTELVDYVTDAILTSYRATHANLGEKDLLSSDLDETAKRLLTKAKHKTGWFTVREAREWVGGVSDQTIQKHLRQLKKRGALISQGRTRGLRYQVVDPWKMIRTGAAEGFEGESDRTSAKGR